MSVNNYALANNNKPSEVMNKRGIMKRYLVKPFSRLKAAEYNAEWYAMIFFALRTGMRYGELGELRWSDVDLKTAVS